MKKKRLSISRPLLGFCCLVLAAAFPFPALAQTLKPSVEDPFSWLEGPVQCDRIKTDFRGRYGVGDANSKALTPVLEEELRHLVGETCENTRYAQCAFSWCSGRQPKQMTKETQKIQELDNAEAEILAALQETNRLVEKAVPAKADPTARAKLELPAEKPPVEKQAVAAAAVPPAVTEPVTEPVTADPNKLAEQQLADMFRDRETSQRRLIESRAAGERSKGTLWIPIRVPGADRVPRIRPAIDSSAVPRSNPIHGGGAAGNGFGRTITPGLGSPGASDTASAEGPSYMINGIRQVPIADDDRHSYRRILENARTARNAVASE